jgi:hypothetical protein
MFNLDPRAKDKVASLKHHIALLLDTVDKRNNELNKNEAELDERNKKLDEKAAELYKCTKELGEKETTLTKLIEVISLQEQRIVHQADIIKNLESQLRLTSTNAETAIQSEKMHSTDSQSSLRSEIMHLKCQLLESNAALSTERDDVIRSTLLLLDAGPSTPKPHLLPILPKTTWGSPCKDAIFCCKNYGMYILKSKIMGKLPRGPHPHHPNCANRSRKKATTSRPKATPF